ncbi:MAG TPA: hypothetical protein VFZ01_18995 [Geminicoccaceae bacterium]
MRTFALYSIIFAGSSLIVVNPVVIHLVTGLRSLAAYTALVDLWLLLIIVAGGLYLRRPGRLFGVALIGAVATLLPALFAGEVLLVLLRHGYGDRIVGEMPDIFEPDPQLIYTLVPGAEGRHTSLGNFDVAYRIDDQGRKAIPASGKAERSLHVFGDSFTFGYGVGNEDTWLNLVDQRLGPEIDVLNYGVIGYSLEQMLLALERYRDQIEPGDVVLFAPISDDLERSLPGRSYVCGGMIRSEANETFPVLEADGTWRMARLEEECSFLFDTVLANSPLPVGFGALWRSWRARRGHEAMIDNADRIFAAAEEVAERAGASFHVVFPASPDECANGRLAFDLADLETPLRSFLEACPASREEALALRFPFDGHWNPAGHAWAAATLIEVLRELPHGRSGDLLASDG